MHVHLDAVGGVAGDMFLAALLDARPDLADGALAAMRVAGLPAEWTAEVREGVQNGMAGKRFAVEGPKAKAGHGHSHAHGHAHAHAHSGATTWRAIRGMLEGSGLADGVKGRAIAIFTRLAEAEGAIHGKAPDEVHFHEVADWDSVADIVGAAYVIDALGAATWSVSALPVGGGTVKTAHGLLPVPAPATARLLAGFETVDDGVPGERVTPTGAAILAHLGAARSAPGGRGRLAAQGIGLGTRELAGVPNILRALIFEGAAEKKEGFAETEVAVLEFEVDDQTPEDLAVGLDNIRARADVLDVVQAPVFGKKGRIAMAIRVLCRQAAVEDVAAACFTETTTIGLRCQVARRFELARREVETGGVRTKAIERPGGLRSAKAEIEDLHGVEGGHEARERLRRAAEDGTKDDDE